MRQMMFNGKDISIAQSLNNLAILYYRIENYASFLKYSLKALDLKIELHNGNDHVEVANTLSNISSAYQLMKDYTNSLKYSLECLQMRENLLKSHPTTVESLWQVGMVYGLIGDHTKSVTYLEKALKMKTDLIKKNGKINVEMILASLCKNLENDLSEAKKKLVNEQVA